MEKINRTYNSIDKVLSKNRQMTLFISITSIIAVLIMAVLVYLNNQKDMWAVDNDGDIVSLKKVSKKNVFLIEADNHIRLFYSRFFSYDKSNYEKKVELGLHMGGISVQKLYETYKVKGWYGQVVNNDIVLNSYVPEDKIQFEYISDGVAKFRADGFQEVTRAHIKQLRHLSIKGIIRRHDDGRIKILNPHGLVIENLVMLNNEIVIEE